MFPTLPIPVLFTFPVLLNFLSAFTFQISRTNEYACVYQEQLKPIEKKINNQLIVLCKRKYVTMRRFFYW